MNSSIIRCPWCGDDKLYQEYHDNEWGKPLHDDARLFEMLTLEGAQAGLSWLTILRKREGYRRAFSGFDPYKVAEFNESEVARLMADSSIIRNRLKITSTITNARAVLSIKTCYGSLDNYLWSFVNGMPLQNIWNDMSEVPSKTVLSDQMSKNMKKKGFRFVGSTICYSFMQAIGMVNDHLSKCDWRNINN